MGAETGQEDVEFTEDTTQQPKTRPVWGWPVRTNTENQIQEYKKIILVEDEGGGYWKNEEIRENLS